jgi:hypothetical protein
VPLLANLGLCRLARHDESWPATLVAGVTFAIQQFLISKYTTPLRSLASQIKEHMLSRLADCLEEFDARAKENCAQVHCAGDAISRSQEPMVTSREIILAAVRANRPPVRAFPEVPLFEKTTGSLMDALVRMGGTLAIKQSGKNLDGFVRSLFPQARSARRLRRWKEREL